MRHLYMPFILVMLLLILNSCGSDFPDESDQPSTDGDGADGDSDQTIDGDDEIESADSDPEPAGPATHFLFGYAETDITPPTGTILGGYGAPGQHRATTGAHDPLMAQASWISNDAGEGILLITLDIAGYMYEFGDWGPGVRELRESIIERVSGSIALEPKQIVLTASHTHAGTDLIGFFQDIGKGVDKDLLDWHITTLTDLAEEAISNSESVKLYFAQSELTGMSARDKSCSPVLDTSVSIMQIRRDDEIILATYANYAKHPTVLPEANKEASADFIWGYREELAAATGGAAIFIQGFVAAVHGGPNFSSQDTMWDETYAMGKTLADVVLDESISFTEADSFDIENLEAFYNCEAKDSYLNDTHLLFNMPKRTVIEEDGKLLVAEIPVSWHRIGPAEFAVLPGEPTPEYGAALRERMASPFTFMVGLGNDCIGYLLDPESVANDTSGQLMGYEAKMGLGLQSGPCMWEAMEGLGWFDGTGQQ